MFNEEKLTELTYTFPTENQKLINQCITDLVNHGWTLISREEIEKNTKINFVMKNSDLETKK
jgi:hypothetical protein